MNILSEPNIYLVGVQMSTDAVFDFLQDEDTTWDTDGVNEGEVLAELAGRVCYMSFGYKQGRKSNVEYLSNIIESGHGSVLEHVVFNLIITGVSRSLSHELVRHRAGWAYSQLSQRYVDESDANYLEPEVIANDPEAHRLWSEAIGHAHASYKALSDRLTALVTRNHPALSNTEKRKMARQAARSVLPNATETKIFVTANARALRHFLELRGSAAAEAEIRRLAVKMLELLQTEAPTIFGDFDTEKLPDGSTGIVVSHHKV
jgi:thymidylate synthase (FAD)